MKRATLLLACMLMAAATAHAATPGPPEAQLGWRLAFGGGHEPRIGYGLSLAVSSGELAGARLLELDVTERSTLARLAGLPLWQPRYRLGQNEAPYAEDSGEDAETSSRPWYARSWVMWTAGGLAATGAVLASFMSDMNGSFEDCVGDCDGADQPSGNGGVLCGGNTGPVEHPDDCTVPLPGFTAAQPAFAGTEAPPGYELPMGGMGDLVAR